MKFLHQGHWPVIFLLPVLIFFCQSAKAQPDKSHNLKFDHLPDRWDRGIPLGNGMIGLLVWQKEGNLRLSVDRADLWDLRPTREIEKYTYHWAYEHRLSGQWDTVWKVADEPYDRDPAPTKLPGAALEFDIKNLGEVEFAELNIASAICTIKWKKGTTFRVFVDATHPLVRYQWEGSGLPPALIPPAYTATGTEGTSNQVVVGADLRLLGYSAGIIRSKAGLVTYTQPAWGNLAYQVAVITRGDAGVASITSHYKDRPKTIKAGKLVRKAIAIPFEEAAFSHKQWWLDFWNKSSIRIPDAVLEKQWYLEMYKLGAASRKGAPPISLQAVWTADNGKLPPWKGDFHNDLNTQLSYWPAYSSNHTEEAAVFTDWLWENKPYFERYTKRVFGTNGINVPGVATLRGHEMGGWHMYAMSPTVSCWLAQHFYLQWRYTADRQFLEERAYPWISGVARQIEQVTVVDNGIRKLPMSSSPEFHDGNMNAWFLDMTNYDIALCRYIFTITSELAGKLDKASEASHWKAIREQFPGFDTDPLEGLTVAPGYPYHESHRHFSHLMAIHPLGLLDFNDEQDREIMLKSIANLEQQGTSWWCGYSFSWLGNIYARIKQGDKAAEALRTFASCFCSPNSFHLNGDQCKAGHSNFTYDPFTLEGNFAFAAGLQEMLLQSHSGYIEVFPAVPAGWNDISFSDLRAEGAFLVSAVKSEGQAETVKIKALSGGVAHIRLPFLTYYIAGSEKANPQKPIGKELTFVFEPGGWIELKNGYE